MMNVIDAKSNSINDTATLCGQFRLWKNHGEHRDLMVKVTLSEPPSS